jgi:hypothetical protein
MVKNVKLGILEQSLSVLQSLAKEQQVSIRVAYSLLNMYKKIEDILKLFYNKRLSLYEKYGERVDRDNIKVKPENEQEFLAEYEKLVNEEIELDIPNITIDDLDKIKISVENLEKVIWLINDQK